MKKIIIIFAVLLLAGGGVFYWSYRHKAAPKPVPKVTTPAAKTLPVPVRSESVATPQPMVTNGYVIGVLSLSKSANGEYIQLKVTNDGDTVLQLLPDEQFKLAGLTSHEVRVPIAGKTTPEFKGELALNSERIGTIIFDTFVAEQSELRFYPDTTSKEYIVVPLITLPSEQQ